MSQYAYAVIDGHQSYGAAERAAKRLNAGNANDYYYVVDWNAGRNDRLPPNDSHCPCTEWMQSGNKVR